MAPQLKGNDCPIFDIRQEELKFSVVDEIHDGLRKEIADRTLPTLLLYDEPGLKLFEDITYLDQYYLTNAEIEVLKEHAGSIASEISAGSSIIELGSGNLRKVRILLEALEDAGKDIEYYALDLSLPELQRTLSAVPGESFKHVKCHGLFGTYADGLNWLKQPKNRERPYCILSMGSSVGNFNRQEAACFLKDFSQVLRSSDLMLIGLDACQSEEKIFHAYNDRFGTTHTFYRNGLVHANRLLGKDIFQHKDWRVVGEYSAAKQCHQAFFEATGDLAVFGVQIRAGDRIRVEESYKYSAGQSRELWKSAGLVPKASYGNWSDDFHIHMLSSLAMAFPLKPEKYASQPVPSLAEFEQLWKVWDTVTRQMLPEKELLSKPIKLRNCCLFYLGHIPTFLDIHLTGATDGRSTEPSYYTRIFERGIDPDVENPAECHTHSEIPAEWPPAKEIIAFQENVRNRARKAYTEGTAEASRKVGRALWIGFEHEAMHLETLLYMLVQSDKILAPGATPDFKTIAQVARENAVPNEWVKIPATTLTVGIDDPEKDFGPDRYFGWDNEKPQRQVKVSAFEAKARPITNREYAQYLGQTRQSRIPASWVPAVQDLRSGDRDVRNENDASQAKRGGTCLNGHGPALTNAYLKGHSVRTVYGPVPLSQALDWPALASYDELSGCAKWMNGRIPTAEEARSIYNHADSLKAKEAEKVQVATISAVNGHLSNDGVEESPPSRSSRKSASGAAGPLDPYQLFTDLDGCNVGFQHFHPLPVSQNGDNLAGQGGMGGAWEWTSSVLEEHKGFEPMGLYPKYTADFFDGKHNVVFGGSWATHPRIAGRKSFVNWYQHNYPYVWTGARLVRDAE